MIANEYLVKVLNDVCYLLENDEVIFNWHEPHNCPVGILVQVANNISSQELYNILVSSSTGMFYYHIESWRLIAEHYREGWLLDTPLENVVNTLLELGLEIDDLPMIEKANRLLVFNTVNSTVLTIDNYLDFLQSLIIELQDKLSDKETDKVVIF